MSTLELGWYWSENKEEYQMAKIAEKDRATHFYITGATGTGKTKFLEYMIQQDISKGNGFGVIDPHGDLIEDIKGFLACYYDESEDNNEISERVVLIDPTDPDLTVTFNPLEKMPNISVPEQANELVSGFKSIWSDSWGARMEEMLTNSFIALAENNLTLAELPLLLTNYHFRNNIALNVQNPITRQYLKTMNTWSYKMRAFWTESTLNKVNAFLVDERIRHILCNPKSSFNIREIIDNKKILLINLDKGKLKDAGDLLGSLFMSKIQMAAFSRSDIPENKRVPFYLYIDEFQNFASESFSIVLSEARKYRLSLIMAHQSLGQISKELRSLILGNTGIQVFFRLNRQDSQLLAKETFEYSGFEVKAIKSFRPVYWSLAEEWEHHIEELQSLPLRVCYIKHKIEGGVIPISTAEIEPAWDSLIMNEEEYREHIKSIPFGRKYLVKREEIKTQAEKEQTPIKKEYIGKHTEKTKDTTAVGRQSKPQREIMVHEGSELTFAERNFLKYISENPGMFVTKIYKALQLSGYRGDNLKKSLIRKGLITQQVTRKGQKGRLAKTLSLTDKGTAVLKKTAQKGKGGDVHKQIQMMLKDQAEVFGWKAVIEERIPRSLESVDLGLKKDGLRVAVEISSTTRADQEIQNIRKCLDAGYDYIISVCIDEKSLKLIKNETSKRFTAREKERIRVYTPNQVKSFLSSIFSAHIVSDKGIVSDQITKEKQLLDTKEASEFLGIKKNTLYEWVVQKKIPYVKVGRLLKFRKEDLEAWLKRRTHEEEEDYI